MFSGCTVFPEALGKYLFNSEFNHWLIVKQEEDNKKTG